MYTADLVRSIEPLPTGLTMDFLRASSYTGSTTTGQDAVSLGMVSKTSVPGPPHPPCGGHHRHRQDPAGALASTAMAFGAFSSD